MKRRLYLVRHAEVRDKGRFHGSTDVELSEKGLRQAQRLAERARDWNPDRLAGSDLKRVRQTARPLAQHLGLELHVDPDLRECHFGRWENLSWEEIEQLDPGPAAAFLKDWVRNGAPQGETMEQMWRRVQAAWRRQWETSWRRLVLVGHAGTNLLLLAHFLEMPLSNLFRIRCDYTTVAVVDFKEGVPQLISLQRD
ncbi:MAG TPA: histidine phosphatase family protein [Acidobacteriota bacterium]|nr:histidine phosphatase family protein [Acidobacteriota bacterium]